MNTIHIYILLYLISGISWGAWGIHYLLHFDEEFFEDARTLPKIALNIAIVVSFIWVTLTWPIDIPSYVIKDILLKNKRK